MADCRVQIADCGRKMPITLGRWLAAAGAVALGASAFAMQADPPRSQSKVVITQPLPHMDGAHLETTVVDVMYPPGGANTTHRHPCPVVGYVLEGALRMQVMGKAETIYSAGETFYESPTDVHVISANASRDKPARFLAYFVCDHKTPLSVPVPPAKGK